MQATVLIHVAAGATALAAGYVALYAAKGATLHRRSGMLFVWAMLTMCAAGITLSALRGSAPTINIPAGLVTAYLVVTSLVTVRRPAVGARRIEVGAMVVGLAVGLVTVSFGIDLLVRGATRDGIPAFPYFLLGLPALLGGIADVRMLRGRPLTGAPRLARHLGRMTYALFIAAMSFFLGQADELPKAMRIPALLALPVLAVLVTMIYWMWRVRIRRSLRGMIGVRPAGAAPSL